MGSKDVRMMFEGIGSFRNIGTLNSYLQQRKLRFAASYKMRTGQRLSDAVKEVNSGVVNSMLSSARKADDEASRQRVSLIRQKLMSGRRVSQTEIEYLRERDPSLYRKARKAEEYREELKARLKKCKTKQEAQMAVAQSMVRAAAEIGAELEAAKGMAGGGSMPSASTFGEPGSVPSADSSGAGAEKAASAASDGAAGVSAETETTGGIPEKGTSAGACDESGGSAGADARQAAARETEKAGEGTDGKATGGKTEAGFPGTAAKVGGDMSPDSILEKYIMIIRAIQDEWARFSGSDEYKKLPENPIEAAKEKKSGRKNPPVRVEEPGRNIVHMLNAYRDTEIHMKEFELEMGRKPRGKAQNKSSAQA